MMRKLRYFYIDPAELQKEPVTLRGSDVRHIKNVLRLKPGSRICLVDGEGFEYHAIIQRFWVDRVELEIMHRQQGKKESPVRISVAQGLLKEKKMDRLLRHLCELGIDDWIPFICERSIPTFEAKRLASRRERWQKIVQESVKQCQRAKLPQIGETTMFQDVLEVGQSCDLTIVFFENEDATLNSLVTPALQTSVQNILLILGPEGGFANGEIEMARAAGCRVAGLGPRILRAETASIAACTLVQYLFGDMG
ncbi:MAG: RsmE family RNA methyltransferase [Desulfobacterales bacterium]|jgi:16S rRNA (uracil1498-N3)-methyltransferase